MNVVASNSATTPRVGLVVVDDGLYTHRWVAPLFDNPCLHIVCAACLSPFHAVNFNPGDARGLWPVTAARLAYYGPKATCKFAGKAIAASFLDLLFRLGWPNTACSVSSAARAHGVEVLRPNDIHHPAFLARLASCHPDLLVCAFSQRAAPAFLTLPRWGCLNVHFSMLPQHRGREPLFRALLARKGAGVSISWMTTRIDAGAVILQKPLDVSSFQTIHQLILAACRLAAEVVPSAILRAVEHPHGESPARPLPPLCGWPGPEEIALFRQRGLRFI